MINKIIEKIKHKYSMFFDKEYKEKHRLTYFPRYTKTTTFLLNLDSDILIVDGKSFLSGYEEIYLRHNYRFETKNLEPLIIDCGSNIGLSILYFKKLYPEAKIISFEPDPNIFEVLKHNIAVNNLENISVRQNAIWNKNETITFEMEGGFSGKITESSKDSSTKKTKVEAIRLLDILREFKKIDFLKIDIEGAEYEVIVDCQDYLKNIDYLFIEYHSFYEKTQRLSEILQILTNNKFRYIVKEANTPKFPFLQKNGEGFDFQVEIFAYKNEK
ncbi:MAG: FkbM family methyltransferase [Cytophagia bacterium]|nr:MAG: FkbM family methyltransferase [Cytophagia bacterium]TAG44390.1 MAG: FkbM family methyltransferase [Cytophagia bacterium]